MAIRHNPVTADSDARYVTFAVVVCVCCGDGAFADDTTSLFYGVFYRAIRENNNIANITKSIVLSIKTRSIF
jgi:hypothetical protein